MFMFQAAAEPKTPLLAEDHQHNFNPNISAEPEFLETLQKGISMSKLHKNGKLYRRKFKIEDDFLIIRQVDSKKKGWFRKATCLPAQVLKVEVNEIDTIREGPQSDAFNKHFNKLKKRNVEENQCMAIVYARETCLNLVLDSEEERNAWLKGLKYLQMRSEEDGLKSEQEMWMREMFHKADLDDSGTLNFKEVKRVLAYMNMDASNTTAAAIHNLKDTSGLWTLQDYMDFCRKLTDREEIKSIFNKYSKHSKYLDVHKLQHFFKTEQGEDLSSQECKELIKNYEKCLCVQHKDRMSYSAFHAMMDTPIMNIFNTEHSKVYQDMMRPLAHYWVDSSHNTYLTAGQLRGPSAVDAYIRALIRGCRCVELDCWDGPQGEPIIYHGYTMTTKITFKDTLEGIKQFAFEKTDYPLILSIENHCSLEQQHAMAHLFKDILGDLLFTTPLPDITALPCPEELRGKIVIKAKSLPENCEGDGEISEDDEAASMEDEEVKGKVDKKKKHTMTLCHDLSDMVNICKSVKFKGFEHAAEQYTCKQMSSFGEAKAGKLTSRSPKEYIVHNQRQLSRVYPSGKRIQSTNYNPLPFWNTGCQIVALNYQTDDEHMMVYKGRFNDNGRCGFILKPDILLKDDTFNPNLPASEQPPEWKKTIEIKIISGYQLPKSKIEKSKNIIDPYIQVEVLGIPSDHQFQQTTYVLNNGFNPVWNQVVTFEVSVPDLAVVIFKLWDYEVGSDDLVAQYALPFNSIQTGYRNVHLSNTQGDHIHGATLFVHVTIK